jgi:hypothetical protein
MDSKGLELGEQPSVGESGQRLVVVASSKQQNSKPKAKKPSNQLKPEIRKEVVAEPESFFPDVPDIAPLATPEQEAEQRRVAQAREADYRAKVEKIHKSMGAAVRQLEIIERKDEMGQRLHAADIKHLRGAISQMLNIASPELRPVALVAYGEAKVTNLELRRDALEDALDDLVDAGVLIEKKETKDSPYVRAYGRTFVVSSELISWKEAGKLLESIQTKATEVAEAGRAFFENALRALKAKANMSAGAVSDLSENGFVAYVHVPMHNRPVVYRQGSELVHSTKEQADGHLLVEVSNGMINVVEALGSCSWLQGISMKREQLLAEQLKLDYRVEPDIFKKLNQLHENLRFGIQATLDEEAREHAKAQARETYNASVKAEREEWQTKLTTFTAVKDFVASTEAGTVFFSVPKPWKRNVRIEGKPDRVETTWNVFGLIERNDKGQIRVIVPDRLKALFGGAQDWTALNDAPYPLGSILRMLAGK